MSPVRRPVSMAQSRPRWRRLGRGRGLPLPPRAVDAVIAAGLLLWSVPEVPWWWRGTGGRSGVPMWAAVGLSLAQSVPFLWRRSRPELVFAVVAAAGLLKFGLLPRGVSGPGALLLAAYGLGAYGGTVGRRAARYLGRTGIVVTCGLAAGIFGAQHRSWGLLSALLAAALLVGEVDRLRRDAVATAADEARLAERGRIARELHDILAHQLSGISLAAGAARRAGQNRQAGRADPVPETTISTLGVIETSARQALNELSNLLGVLRKDPDGQLADLRPAPTLTDLPELLDRLRATGVKAEVRVAGAVRPVSGGIGLAAYRIVQEAVTNATRHSTGAGVLIDLAYESDRLCLRIANSPPTGRRAGDGAPGNGLRGIGERVRLYGGHLHAGPTPDGGYLVTAVLYDAQAGRKP